MLILFTERRAKLIDKTPLKWYIYCNIGFNVYFWQNNSREVLSMKNSVIKKLCPEDSAYKFRPDTDKLFQLPEGSFSYAGIIDKEIRHIENKYLLNADTWALFVNQFRSNVDDDLAWRCEYWGKMMRGACFTYEYTKSDNLYKVLCDTVRDIMTTQDELGRITTYSVEKEFDGWDLWGRKYIMLGMQYFLDICKDEQFKSEIIAVMCRHADYIMSKVGPVSEGKKNITDCSRHWLGLNSSSILEPYVRLYNLTGEKKYFDYAAYIVDNGGISAGNIFELAYEGKLYPYQYPTHKAYEMMSCFEGLLEFYRVTKNERYKTAVVNFARLVLESDISIIGCSGCTHELFDYSARRQSTTTYPGIMQETCVTVTWMKFCFQLLGITGDSVFADAIETSVYNAMLGAVNSYDSPMIKGMPFDSYSPLFMGLRSRNTGGYQEMENHTEAYGCCACIGAAGTGLMALTSTMLAENGIYMNLYIPGAVHAYSPSGKPVRLLINTLYPASSKINIQVNGADGSETFTVALRIPGWCKNKYKVTVNGVCACNSEIKNGYLLLERAWNWGDEIDLEFEMKMHIVNPPLGGSDENSKYLVALAKGPVIFARDARLGEETDSVVDILCDENGVVDAVPSITASFPVEQEYKIPMRDGSYITVVDYQSAGKTWDERSVMSAWLPTKNFWSFDETKPVYLMNRDTSNFFVFGTKDGDDNVYRVAEGIRPVAWTIERVDGGVRFKADDGRYLTAFKDENDGIIHARLCEFKDCDCQVWNMNHLITNRYRVESKKYENMCLMINFKGNGDFILIDKTLNESFHGRSCTNNAFIDIKNI